MDSFFSDRRCKKRYSDTIPCEYKILDEDIDIMELRYKKAKTKNISLGGLCVETDDKVLPGSLIRVEIQLGDTPKKIDTFCEVEWARKGNERYMAGLSFISLDELTAGMLKEYLGKYN